MSFCALKSLRISSRCWGRERAIFFMGPMREGFLEKVSADGFQVGTEEITKPEVLLVAEILTAFEQQPA